MRNNYFNNINLDEFSDVISECEDGIIYIKNNEYIHTLYNDILTTYKGDIIIGNKIDKIFISSLEDLKNVFSKYRISSKLELILKKL